MTTKWRRLSLAIAAAIGASIGIGVAYRVDPERAIDNALAPYMNMRIEREGIQETVARDIDGRESWRLEINITVLEVLQECDQVGVQKRLHRFGDAFPAANEVSVTKQVVPPNEAPKLVRSGINLTRPLKAGKYLLTWETICYRLVDTADGTVGASGETERPLKQVGLPALAQICFAMGDSGSSSALIEPLPESCFEQSSAG